MSVTITGVNQTGDTLHLAYAVSKVWCAHTMKFGGQYQFQQVRLEPNATFNGTFTFAGTETGSDFADFLLGAPSNYIQSSGGIFYLRNQYGGVFAQDSWRARSNLTINYGLRWDLMAPWYERNNQIQTVVPGQQSAVYPGVPPYGYNYLSPAPPLFETPFITAADGTNNGQRFPQQFPPFGATPDNPVTNIDWSQFLPVNADPFFGSDNKTPYSENFMFSVQRELAPNM